jgi:hypothetical protein
MQQAGWPTPKITFILALAEWVLNNSYVSFDNKTYKQIKGTAMGTPFAVTYANIFMHQHEMAALLKFIIKFAYSPITIQRLIDDFFAIVRSIEEAEYLKLCLNHSGLIITGGHDTQSVDFLDITIFKGIHLTTHDILDTKLFQKPMNTYGYIMFNSFHNPQMFTNFVVGELRRYTIACSNESDFNYACKLFKTRLLARLYPLDFINHIFTTTSFNRQQLLHKAAIKISKIFINTHNMIDPNDIAPIALHFPHTTRDLPKEAFDILHQLPNYLLCDPLSKLVFNTNRPFLFASKQSPSNLHWLVRSDTESFYTKCIQSTP